MQNGRMMNVFDDVKIKQDHLQLTKTQKQLEIYELHVEYSSKRISNNPLIYFLIRCDKMYMYVCFMIKSRFTTK